MAHDDDTRPQQGGEADTTRFGMEDGDNADTPATGTDPERQNGAADRDPSDSSEREIEAENEAAKLGDFA